MIRLISIVTVTLACFCTAVPAQQPDVVHKIGLIDMAHVFKHYEKFTVMTETLQKEIEQRDTEAKAQIQQLQQIEAQLSGGDLPEGSPEFVRLEMQMLELQTRLQSLRQTAQRDFLKKEAELYKTVYLEVEDAVRRYSRYFNYTLVMRFDRKGVTEAENPRDIISGMNRQVLFHRVEDDLTDPILDYLNDTWRKKQAAGEAISPAGR